MDKVWLWLQQKANSETGWVRVLAFAGIGIFTTVLYLWYASTRDRINKAEVKEELEKETAKDQELKAELNKINDQEKVVDEKIVTNKKVIQAQEKVLQDNHRSHEDHKKAIDSIQSWEDLDKFYDNK